MKKYLILPLFLSLALSSCTHKTQDVMLTADYLIVGNMRGFVATPQTTYYLLQGNTLTADTTVMGGAVPSDINLFHFNVPEPSSKYDSAKSLLSAVPGELLKRNNAHIGNLVPDAGYKDVFASVNGVVYRWYFEYEQGSSSPAIQHFVNTLQTTLR